ncbi:MAG: hypothetical protein ACLRPQ_01395 [Streptococcus sp.]
MTNAAPSIATRAADSTIRINANRNTNITITASGTTPNVTIITGPNTPKPNVTVTSPWHKTKCDHCNAAKSTQQTCSTKSTVST